MKLILDFETASACDLSKAGPDRYAQDPTTEVLCLCITTTYGDDVLDWRPGSSTDPLHALIHTTPEWVFEAHNAGFEQAIWKHIMVPQFGLPPIPISRWSDTMAVAAFRGLPLGLDNCTKALDLPVQKDIEGSKITIALSKPQTQVAWMDERPEGITQAEWKRRFIPGRLDRCEKVMQRVVSYCYQDCATEAALGNVIGDLTPYERRVWEHDQVINQRGVRIDIPYVQQCLKVFEGVSWKLLTEFIQITGGLRPGQVDKTVAWIASHGVYLDNLQKDTLDKLLGDDDDEDPPPAIDLPLPVRRALQIRRQLGSASVKKLQRMLACVSPDGRVRGLLQYHGAGTGRWAGRLFQPQNFPRGTLTVDDDPPPPEILVDALMTGDYEYVDALYGDIFAALTTGLRHALVPDRGNLFCAGDFSGIEARIVLALAGQHDKTALMASGQDVYLDLASIIFKTPVTSKKDPRRQYGKNGVLGCGFQCGDENFNNKFLGGKEIDLAKKVVHTYRYDWAPEVPKFWKGLEAAALKGATEGYGEAYGVVYQKEGNWLGCHLPDKQIMWYFNPQPRLKRMPWQDEDEPEKLCWSYQAMKTGQWKTIDAYGGLMTENVVQKLARGMLCDAMQRLEENGFPVVLTVHDEVISEVPSMCADEEAFAQIMAAPTKTANALKVPIAIDKWVGDRYKK